MPEDDDKALEVFIPMCLDWTNQELETIDVKSTLDRVMSIHERLEVLNKAMCFMRQELERRMIDWINANGDIVVGTVRYYVGKKKTTKAKDNSTVLDMLYTALAGDESMVCKCMSANPWKHGTIRGILDDDKLFDMLFETTEQMDLKTGKPKRGLQRVDSKYL